MPETNEHIITLFDRRVGKIEDGLDLLTRNVQMQRETLEQMSEALRAVVRLEERLTASIENSREQQQSLQRVHDRLDKYTETLREELEKVYLRIEDERKACDAKFKPVNDTINQQRGALRFASVIFPLMVTVLIAVGGSFIKSQNEEISEMKRAINQVRK